MVKITGENITAESYCKNITNKVHIIYKYILLKQIHIPIIVRKIKFRLLRTTYM
jgi:hypothetical protein